MPRGQLGLGHPQRHPGGLPDQQPGLHRVGPAGRPAGAPPAASRPVAGQHHADVHRLRRQGGLDLGELGVRRAPVHRRVRHRLRDVVRQHDLLDRVEGQVGGAAGPVADERVEQAGQQRGAQLGPVGVERVEHPHGAAPHVVGGQPERVPHRGVDERERQHLDVAVLGQRPGHRTAAALARAQPAPGRGGRQHRRDAVVALQPQHLLDQVGGLLQVRPPGRRGGLHPGPARRRRWTARRRSRSGSAGARWPPAGSRPRPPGPAAPAASARRARPAPCPRRSARRPACPPPCSTSSCAARSAATGGSSGSTVRSNRRDASLGSLCRRAPRAMTAGSKCAASISTSVRAAAARSPTAAISVDAPPITPASPIGPDWSVISRSSGSSRRVTSSSVVSRSPACARRTTMPPRTRAAS